MKKLLLVAGLFGFLCAADIEVSGIYVKQTPPNSKTTAIFAKIQNNAAKDIALVGAKSDLSDRIELHTHIAKGKKMMMSKVEQIPIKAGQSIELKPGSDHIMLFNIKSQVTKDSKIGVVLEFDNGESLEFSELEVKEVAKPSKKHRKQADK